MSEYLKICAVGDISLGDHPICVGHGMRHVFSKYKEKVLEVAEHHFKDADISIGNLETIASDLGLKRNCLASCEMRGDPKSLQYLKNVGIDLLSVSNNHSMQHGEFAFFDTIHHLQREKIGVIGLDDKKNNWTKPYIYKKHGTNHAFIAVSFRPEEWHKGAVPYALRDPENMEEFLQQIKKIREETDGFIVASIHWGLEFLHHPGPDQIRIAHEMVDMGVDLILGHHSHYIQPVEPYKNSLIFYSLGNFVFDMCYPEAKQSIIAKIKLSKDGEHDFSIVPLRINNKFLLQNSNLEDTEKIKFFCKYSAEKFNEYKNMDPFDYMQLYRSKIIKNRPVMYFYFIKNIHKYSLFIIYQSIQRFMARKLCGLFRR